MPTNSKGQKPRQVSESVQEYVLRRKVEVSLADSRPSIPADDVFLRLRARHADWASDFKNDLRED